jgi:predicted DNA-binding transcriptional regulator AlpA
MSPLPEAPVPKRRRVLEVSAAAITAAADPDALITKRVVMALTGLGATTIDRYIKLGTFPEPNRITRRVVRWRAGDVRAWLHAHESPFTLRP